MTLSRLNPFAQPHDNYYSTNHSAAIVPQQAIIPRLLMCDRANDVLTAESTHEMLNNVRNEYSRYIHLTFYLFRCIEFLSGSTYLIFHLFRFI